MTTFPQILSGLLAADAGRPLVTFYDDASGERTELSVTTWANWVAKVSSLLADELDVEHGSRLLVDLPPHWLGTVVLGAAWGCGFEVVWEGDDGDVDAVVTGRDGLGRWASEAGRIPVVASALRPLAGRFPDGVPGGVHDLGAEVWSQPDAYVAWPGPEDGDLAVAGTTQADLWRSAAAGDLADGGRLLSEANPASPSGLASLTEPLARSGSLVLVTQASEERRGRIAADERVTDRFSPAT
ncbi:MAG TPA: TIGR03089 family protein [Nocardioides sp.]|uniref:TIGR03089 family protein n=1 Tax=Nocardioides sp. TaxID=35761 RepID=UPI002F419DA9